MSKCLAIYEGSLAADGNFVLAPAGGDFAVNRNRQFGRTRDYESNARRTLEVGPYDHATIEVAAEAGVTAASVMPKGTMGDPATATFQDLLDTAIDQAGGIEAFDCAVSYLQVALSGYAGPGNVTVRISFYDR